MNITGIWTYTEDFEFGKSQGTADLKQVGNDVTGTFLFTEEVENEYKINVTESVKGIISSGEMLLESTRVIAMHNQDEVHYLPNSFHVHLVSENMLVGSTYDSENVCGVFVMERKM